MKGAVKVMQWIDKLIQKLYLKQKDNMVFTDPNFKVHTSYYFNRLLVKEYQNKECIVVYADVNGLSKFPVEEGDEILRLVIRDIRNLEPKELVKCGGDEFVFLFNKDFNVKNLDTIRRVSYGYVMKEKGEDLTEAMLKASQYAKKRKNKRQKR